MNTNEDPAHNQRLLRAALVCFVLLAVWTVLFPPKPAPKPKKEAPVAAGTVTATATAIAAGRDETPEAVPAPSVEPQIFEFVASESPDAVRLALTNVGGAVESFELPSFKERDEDNWPTEASISLAEPVTASRDAGAQMAGIRFLEGTSFTVPPAPIYEVVEQRRDFVRYRYRTPEGVEIDREFLVKAEGSEEDAVVLELAVTIRNRSSQSQRHRLAIEAAQKVQPVMKGGGWFMPAPDHLNGVCYADGTIEREPHAALLKETETFREAVKWVGVDRQYFVTALIQRDDGGEPSECVLAAQGDLVRASLRMAQVELRPGDERRHKFTGYLGVKKPALLTRVDSQLEDAIDYRIMGLNLAALCEGLLAILALIHGLTGSWGLAIIGLTVLVKGALFPLTHRSMKSMRAVSQLKPEMDALREKYKDDRQRQSEEMMKLYRKHEINPAGGCVPMLFQMPIWFALYRALWVSVDLYQQPFLWIADLTAQDPYWILPVALVVVMFVQQRLTPTTLDPMQQKMMLYFMPLMFGFMMAALPAGLCFYILVNSLLTIVQQQLINKSIGPMGGAQSAQGAPA